MSTMQMMIIFPIMFLLIVILLQMGPTLYMEANQTAAFHLFSIQENLSSTGVYVHRPGSMFGSHSRSWITTAPDKMHFLVRGVRDSVTIFKGGKAVDSLAQ